MKKNLVPDLLQQLDSRETFTRNDAIKKIIKDKINDEQIIAALKGVIENDPSISVRNFARSALDVFGVEHSTMEDEEVIKYTKTAFPTHNDSQNTKTTYKADQKKFSLLAIVIVIFLCLLFLVLAPYMACYFICQ